MTAVRHGPQYDALPKSDLQGTGVGVVATPIDSGLRKKLDRKPDHNASEGYQHDSQQYQ